MSHGTPSDLGGYIQFQTEVLRQLPRPHEISPGVQKGWMNNRAALRETLYELVVPVKSSELLEVLPKAIPLESVSNFSEAYSFAKLWRELPTVYSFESSYTPRERWREDGLKKVESTDLTVCVVKEDCSFAEGFLALGARTATEWSDLYRLLTEYVGSGKGRLHRGHHQNFFFIRARLFCVSYWHDRRAWSLLECSPFPHQSSDYGPRQFYKGDRIYIR